MRSEQYIFCVRVDLRLIETSQLYLCFHGSPKELQKEAGFDTAAIVNAVRKALKTEVKVTSFN